VSDLERFLSLLEDIRQALAVLNRYRRTIARDRLLAEIDVQNMVLFALYRAVQACIDAGQHVIAERGLPVPSAYREVFRVLGDAGILDPSLTLRLERWGGFRNILAHQYGTLDLERVARALYDDLPDLEAFTATLARLIPSDTGG
jgi:uncharacterized protein YutE (UPF0331/DUF86 family)